ncbi:MAG: carbohydrate binding domain-containing protein [Candidatus Firestonebacteria bacterium]
MFGKLKSVVKVNEVGENIVAKIKHISGIAFKIVLLILQIGFLLVKAEGKNLIENPGFENGNLNWKMNKPWDINDTEGKNNSKCVSVDYNVDAKWKKVISDDIMLTPGKYYRLSIWCKSNIDINPVDLEKKYAIRGFNFSAVNPYVLEVNKTFASFSETQNYNIFGGWMQLVHYFNPGTFTIAKLRFYADYYPDCKIWLDDAELVELADSDLKENLIINPDFEDGEDGGFPVMWSYMNKPEESKCKIILDSSAGFIRGTKSVKIDGTFLKGYPDSLECNVRSISVPIVEGKDYIFSVWLKAKDIDTAARLQVNSVVLPYSGNAAKYFSKNIGLNITTEWRKYFLEVHIPGPEEDKYSPGRVMSCAIGLKGEGILWVDEVKMMQKQ